MKWTRIDNLPGDLNEMFCYISEDAECKGFKEDFEVCNYVEEQFKADYDNIWKRIRFEDDIYSEYCEHDLCDGEDKSTYAVYIYFNDTTIKVIKKLYPEEFI